MISNSLNLNQAWVKNRSPSWICPSALRAVDKSIDFWGCVGAETPHGHWPQRAGSVVKEPGPKPGWFWEILPLGMEVCLWASPLFFPPPQSSLKYTELINAQGKLYGTSWSPWTAFLSLLLKSLLFWVDRCYFRNSLRDHFCFRKPLNYLQFFNQELNELIRDWTGLIPSGFWAHYDNPSTQNIWHQQLPYRSFTEKGREKKEELHSRVMALLPGAMEHGSSEMQRAFSCHHQIKDVVGLLHLKGAINLIK